MTGGASPTCLQPADGGGVKHLKAKTRAQCPGPNSQEAKTQSRETTLLSIPPTPLTGCGLGTSPNGAALVSSLLTGHVDKNKPSKASSGAGQNPRTAVSPREHAQSVLPTGKPGPRGLPRWGRATFNEVGRVGGKADTPGAHCPDEGRTGHTHQHAGKHAEGEGLAQCGREGDRLGGQHNLRKKRGSGAASPAPSSASQWLPPEPQPACPLASC